MLTAYYLSTGTLTATLTDQAGTGVTGATVTVTIQRAGAGITGATWPVTMTDAGAGAYTYTVPATLLANRTTYLACITAVKSGIQRYAEVELWCEPDAS